ncbi:hypothetical protein JD844_016393 [Phrynosoma platyrhinos]|uniref:Uncharacterized protein n=1 Tax=Phrynosoma platyrhinos TaxID=52577 RepID=A0ABQ7SKJ2_PHRPL|nr:hypothetical protein JD844_016393 [Phrynosoma platyrhinos]
MSVVCSLSAGWILDHLSFINKSGYQLCHSQDCSGWVSLNDSLRAASSDEDVTGSAILAVTDSGRKEPVGEIKASGKKADQKMYVFREEFFNVLKPHIAVNSPTELPQRNSVSSLENGGSEPLERAKNEESCIFTAKTKKKRKRSSELNHGEHDALEYHLKITRSGEFVFPLDSVHKKPYEILVLGRVQGSTDVPLRISEGKVLPPIPAQKLIVSVPCTLHSHKPPLTEILKEYAKPEVECLELFARNLQPGWTSWGNEVLRFQHMDYFTALPNKTD